MFVAVVFVGFRLSVAVIWFVLAILVGCCCLLVGCCYFGFCVSSTFFDFFLFGFILASFTFLLGVVVAVFCWIGCGKLSFGHLNRPRLF